MTQTPEPTEDIHVPDGGRVLVFDSGVGGLTVAQEIAALAPALAIDYAADTGFFPYGDKSDEALRARLPAVAKALFEAAKPDVFVIACNTASTLGLPDVRAALPCPVVGTVPAIKPAAAHSASGVIGLLATPGTLGRDYTADLIAEFASEAHIIKFGTTDLVKLAEAHAHGDGVPDEMFRHIQMPLYGAPRGDEIDTVVLACTHFPLVRDQLIAAAPRPVTYIDSGEAIARQTLRVMPEGLSQSDGGRVFVTDDPARHMDLQVVFERFSFGEIEEVSVSATAQ